MDDKGYKETAFEETNENWLKGFSDSPQPAEGLKEDPNKKDPNKNSNRKKVTGKKSYDQYYKGTAFEETNENWLKGFSDSPSGRLNK